MLLIARVLNLRFSHFVAPLPVINDWSLTHSVTYHLVKGGLVLSITLSQCENQSILEACSAQNSSGLSLALLKVDSYSSGFTAYLCPCAFGWVCTP